MSEANAQMDVSTDSESLAAESGLSESESEDSQVFSISDLRVPIELGWKRETIIRGLTKTGQIRGEVFYYAPGNTNKLKNMNQIFGHLEKNPSKLNRDNFSFSSKAIVGSFLQPAPPQYANDGEFIRMTDTEVAKRLEDLKMYTRHNMLGVEQRIEIAKQQQAMRDAKKMAKDDIGRSKSIKSDNRNDKVEIIKKDKEIKNIQALEARKKRQEELDRIKQEDSIKKLHEKEKKRQESMLLKEQELNKQKELLAAVETVSLLSFQFFNLKYFYVSIKY